MRDGLIVAGPLVRLACARHLEMRTLAARPEGHPKGYRFDTAAADEAIGFIEGELWLGDTSEEGGEPQPFQLLPYQAFIVANVFGWMKATGYRLYRDAYIETGKGSGKTPLAAACGLYGLVMDGEESPYIVSAANSQKQARFLWEDARRMVEVSPNLKGAVLITANCLVYPPNNGKFEAVSAEKRTLDGPRPHMGLIDEVHEAEAEVVGKIRAGAKRRRQPLYMETTNSGHDRGTVCWAHHELSRRVLEGLAEQDSWFAFVCDLDESDQPFRDPACWPKVNPGLPALPTLEYVEAQVQLAQASPADANLVLRLNFCVWTKTITNAFNAQKWAACPPLNEAELVGVPCYAALDLGQTDDFSAFVRLWALPDGRWAFKPRFWIPSDAISKHKDRPYTEWRRGGWLEITPGNTTDYDRVEADIKADCEAAGVRRLAYDKRFAETMAQHLNGAFGTEFAVNFPQGFALNEGIRRFGVLIESGKCLHDGNPILTWMIDNAVTREGRQKDLMLDKTQANEKIDGAVALCMGLTLALGQSKDAVVPMVSLL